MVRKVTFIAAFCFYLLANTNRTHGRFPTQNEVSLWIFYPSRTWPSFIIIKIQLSHIIWLLLPFCWWMWKELLRKSRKKINLLSLINSRSNKIVCHWRILLICWTGICSNVTIVKKLFHSKFLNKNCKIYLFSYFYCKILNICIFIKFCNKYKKITQFLSFKAKSRISKNVL